jgi:hypothetical protein
MPSSPRHSTSLLNTRTFRHTYGQTVFSTFVCWYSRLPVCCETTSGSSEYSGVCKPNRILIKACSFLFQLSENIPSTIISYCARDTKVQPIRLPSETGTVSPYRSLGEIHINNTVTDFRKPSKRFERHNACGGNAVSLSVRLRARHRIRKS